MDVKQKWASEPRMGFVLYILNESRQRASSPKGASMHFRSESLYSWGNKLHIISEERPMTFGFNRVLTVWFANLTCRITQSWLYRRCDAYWKTHNRGAVNPTCLRVADVPPCERESLHPLAEPQHWGCSRRARGNKKPWFLVKATSDCVYKLGKYRTIFKNE